MIQALLSLFADVVKVPIGDGTNDTLNYHAPTALSIGPIMNTVYLVAGMIAVLIIVVAGFFYITSNGDSNQLAKAKNTILYAVIGLVVVMFAFVITQFVISRVHG